MGELREKVVKGAVWTTLERFGTQFVEFFVGLVLARLLTPDDFGTVALTAIFFTVARSLVDGGFGLALVQKKNADELDFNSVFYVSLAVALLMYAGMWAAAPWIARFYAVPELVTIVRVSSLNFFFSAMNSVQMAELNRKMRFDLTFRISLTCCITNGLVGVALALCGFGVWTIVWSGLVTGLVGTVARWLCIGWRPRLMFDASRVRSLFSFGWKSTAATMLDQAFSQLSGLLVGKFYSRADLAFVDRGNGLPSRAISAIENTVATVSFPALVRLQDDPGAMRKAMSRLLGCTMFLVLPALAFSFACADDLILVLFGRKWAAAGTYMRISSVAFSLLPLAALNARAIVALGRTGLALAMSMATKVCVIVAMLVTLRVGLVPFVLATSVVVCLAPTIISMILVRRLLDYPIWDQVRGIVGTVIAVVAVTLLIVGVKFGAVSLAVPQLPFWTTAVLAVQVSVAVPAYFMISYWLKVRALGECLQSAEALLGGRMPRVASVLRRLAPQKECGE